MYACLIDPSKAFDHRILFDKLPERNLLFVFYCTGTRLSNFMSAGWEGLISSSHLIRSIVTVSSCTCNSNFIGYNCLYGDSHCNAYSSDHIAIGNLIREIRTQSLIPHFSDIDLDAIVLSASTM